MIRRGIVAGCVVLGVLAAPSWGHGEEVTTDPSDGAKLRRSPAEIVVTLSEPPAANARLSVSDGCERDLQIAVSVSGDSIVAAPSGGEPGRWRVEWAAISEVDGHATEGTFSFRVRGQSDCSEPEPSEPPPTLDVSEESSPSPTAGGEGEGSFPVVPVALGAAALVAVAALIRFSGGR